MSLNQHIVEHVYKNVEQINFMMYDVCLQNNIERKQQVADIF
jgi:hypothetical protein